MEREQEDWAVSRRLYLAGIDPEAEARDWRAALRAARRSLLAALRASDGLRDPARALRASGAHMLALRHLTAPPKSQDQFRLFCPDWPKSSEKSDRGLSTPAAEATAAAFNRLRDRPLTPWLARASAPTRRELRALLRSRAPLMALKEVETRRRMRLAEAQETAVIARLEAMGWRASPSRQIDRRAELPLRRYMHLTNFATAQGAHQQVDIAIGLGGSYVAAVECKVTNDETNSVKRINDVLKKHHAWKAHWGSFVLTIAVLQGVIKKTDIDRLRDEGVLVFWSHDLDAFAVWLAGAVNEG